MNIRPIRNDEDHAFAVAEIERLWDAEPGTPEDDQLDILITLVDAYEQDRWPIEQPDPIEMLVYIMEQAGHTRKDLVDLLGSSARASEILNRKRPLTRDMIWKLHREWNIPAELLIQPYETGGRAASA